MTPIEFLQEEFENVRRALGDTLRYDYGPERTRPYFEECKARLARIRGSLKKIKPTDFQTIRDRLDELSSLAMWISLIERSRLGEFSWPFAEELKSIAKNLLPQKNLGEEESSPIIHIIAEGDGYQILDERQVLSTSVKNEFTVIAFPRPLKHHVLLHAIFGHELGHSALHTTGNGGAGRILQAEVLKAFIAQGPMATPDTMTAWLRHSGAPPEIKKELKKYDQGNGAFSFDSDDQKYWLDEFICDLCGLLLFGPAFVAAHKSLLQPTYPNPYKIDLEYPTHPPYAARQKLLARALRILKWDNPITESEDKHFHHAEKEFLSFISIDPFDPWAMVFIDSQVRKAIAGVKRVLSSYGGLEYKPPPREKLSTLVQRLIERVPPIIAEIDADGKPTVARTEIAHILYSGWVFWIGRKHLLLSDGLSFFDTNRLCDQALLQQQAINMTHKPDARA
jgi:hypothetical protein